MGRNGKRSVIHSKASEDKLKNNRTIFHNMFVAITANIKISFHYYSFRSFFLRSIIVKHSTDSHYHSGTNLPKYNLAVIGL